MRLLRVPSATCLNSKKVGIFDSKMMKAIYDQTKVAQASADFHLLESLREREAKALYKVIFHNLVVLIHEIHELGIEPKFWQDSSPSGLLN